MEGIPKNEHLRIVRDDSENVKKDKNLNDSSFSNTNLEEFKLNFPDKSELIDSLVEELKIENQKEEKDLEKIEQLELSLREIILS